MSVEDKKNINKNETDEIIEKEEGPSYLQGKTVTGDLLYPDEPARFLNKDLQNLFLWATNIGASDINFQTGLPVMVDLYGKKYKVTKRKLIQSELQEIIVIMYGNESAKGRLASSSDIDCAYEIKPNRNTRLRFRINATAVNVDGTTGIQITARTIPVNIPLLKDMHLRKDLEDYIVPSKGMVVVTGPTGSGKSTLLAAIIRSIADNPKSNKKIVTYEAPIEFVYDALDPEPVSTLISQCEIGVHLPSFAAGTRNALRRKPDIIIVGESRDAETIGEAVTASMTGHALYTTVHSNGFADTIRRMVNVFPEGERNAKAVEIITNLRVVISQTLVPSLDGKRVALREYVVMNNDIVNELLSENLDNLANVCRKVLLEKGRSFLQDAQEKFDQGLISENILQDYIFNASAEEKDINESKRNKLKSIFGKEILEDLEKKEILKSDNKIVENEESQTEIEELDVSIITGDDFEVSDKGIFPVRHKKDIEE